MKKDLLQYFLQRQWYSALLHVEENLPKVKQRKIK